MSSATVVPAFLSQFFEKPVAVTPGTSSSPATTLLAKRASLWGLPGGLPHYRTTLKTVLNSFLWGCPSHDCIEHVRAALQTQEIAVSAKVAAELIGELKDLYLIERHGPQWHLTEAGTAVLRGEWSVLVDALRYHVVGVVEILRWIDEGCGDRRDLLTRLQEQGIVQWKSSCQLDNRLHWLEAFGGVVRENNRFTPGCPTTSYRPRDRAITPPKQRKFHRGIPNPRSVVLKLDETTWELWKARGVQKGFKYQIETLQDMFELYASRGYPFAQLSPADDPPPSSLSLWTKRVWVNAPKDKPLPPSIPHYRVLCGQCDDAELNRNMGVYRLVLWYLRETGHLRETIPWKAHRVLTDLSEGVESWGSIQDQDIVIDRMLRRVGVRLQ